MTKNQNIVMWCGLIILLVYLFTDKNFKSSIFTPPKSPGGVQLDSSSPGANPWGFLETPLPTVPVNRKTTTL